MQDAKRIRLKANISKPAAHIGPIVMDQTLLEQISYLLSEMSVR